MKYKIFAIAILFSFFAANLAHAQSTYILSQVANGSFGGGSYRTTFVLVNNANAHATAILNLTDDNGAPMAMTIPGNGTGSSFTIDLPAGASQMLQTDGQGSVTVGAATITSTSRICVSGIFSIYDSHGNYVTETGVGNSDPQSSFVLPVDTTGLFNTGLALFNPGTITASITMILSDTTGKQVASTVVPLAGGHHTAAFIAGTEQFFPSITHMQGTLVVQCTSSIAAMVLRQNGAPLSFTSLPVVPTTSTKTALYLPQVANGSYGGGSYETSFLLFNISSDPANIVLTLTNDRGNPFTVTIPGHGTDSSFSFSNLAPGASIFLQTDGQGSVSTGAAIITSNVPIGASGIFTVLDLQGAFLTETGVGDSPPLTSFTLPVNRTGNFDTGVAFVNPGSTDVKLTFRLLDRTGAQVGSSATTSLPKANYLAEFVSQIFPGTSGFTTGSLAVTAAAGVAALTLRQNGSPLSYTTLPVASGAAGGTAPLSTTETGINATGNVTQNETLPSGFKLTGVIIGPGQAYSVMASAGQNSFYAGTVNSQGKYVIALPNGTYDLSVSFYPNGSSQTVQMSSPVSGSVQVTGDTTRDIVLPAVTLFNVSGTVNGLSNLGGPTFMSMTFTTSDYSETGSFILAANGSYQGVLPAGSYTAGLTASMSISLPPLSLYPLTPSVAIYNLGSATISGNTVIPAFTVPATATVSGQVNSTGGWPLADTLVTASALPAIYGGCMADTVSAQYEMILPTNVTYGVGVSMSLMRGQIYMGSLSFPLPGMSWTLSSNTTNLDFTVPTLPGFVTISGRVTDSGGNPVSDATVTAYSLSITGVPAVQYSNHVLTDANGNYSMSVLSGTGYILSFYPPMSLQ